MTSGANNANAARARARAMTHEVVRNDRRVACYRPPVSPEDVQRLRETLSCSVGDLARAVGVEVKTVLAWESGDLFPTKTHAVRLEALKSAGPAAIPRKSRGKGAVTGMALLAEPRLWTIVRKLTAHPELLREVEKLAEHYDDPTAAAKP
jgi:DNA-binding transcriptional regulator YiaG